MSSTKLRISLWRSSFCREARISRPEAGGFVSTRFAPVGSVRVVPAVASRISIFGTDPAVRQTIGVLDAENIVASCISVLPRSMHLELSADGLLPPLRWHAAWAVLFAVQDEISDCTFGSDTLIVRCSESKVFSTVDTIPIPACSNLNLVMLWQKMFRWLLNEWKKSDPILMKITYWPGASVSEIRFFLTVGHKVHVVDSIFACVPRLHV